MQSALSLGVNIRFHESNVLIWWPSRIQDSIRIVWSTDHDWLASHWRPLQHAFRRLLDSWKSASYRNHFDKLVCGQPYDHKYESWPPNCWQESKLSYPHSLSSGHLSKLAMRKKVLHCSTILLCVNDLQCSIVVYFWLTKSLAWLHAWINFQYWNSRIHHIWASL